MNLEVFKLNSYRNRMAFKSLQAELLSFNLKRLRDLRGLSQESLAEASRHSHGSIKQFESGKRWPKDLGSLASALEVDIYELLKPVTATPIPLLREPGAPYTAETPVSSLTVKDMEALVSRASKRDSTINLEIERLKRENTQLRGVINQAPQEILQRWPETPSAVKALCLYFVTGRPQFVALLPEKIQTKVRLLFRALGLKPPKGPA